MASKLVTCAFLVLSSATAVSASCPIPIRVGNVTLPSKKTARGLDISIGDPPQRLAFQPLWPQNNTVVYDSACFPSLPDGFCSTFRGGIYAPLASTSRDTPNTTLIAPDSSPSCTWNSESITLGDNATVDLPVGVVLSEWGQQAYDPMNALGLGTNSTILRVLRDTGRIASRSWSFFWGRNGATTDTQVDGVFVLGGYDRAKATGTAYNLSFDTSGQCDSNMVVTIGDVILNLPNGTDVSLFTKDRGAAIRACIDPWWPNLTTIPIQYFATFANITNTPPEAFNRSVGVEFWSMYYVNTSNVYGGSMSFKIINGPTIRIPNDQLVVPYRHIEDNGDITANGSAPQIIWDPNTQVNINDLPKLGRQFFSMAYLMSNLDAGQFTIWSAVNPTSRQDLVAVDTNNNILPSTCDPAIVSEFSSTSTPVGSESHAGSHTLLRGPLAGVIVGSVVGAVGLLAVGFLVVQKRRHGKKIIENQETPDKDEFLGHNEIAEPPLLPPGPPGELNADPAHKDPVELP